MGRLGSCQRWQPDPVLYVSECWCLSCKTPTPLVEELVEMRGGIGRRINNPNHFLNSTTPFSLQPSSSFCSASGRGRGRSTPFQFTAAKPAAPGQPDTDSKPDPPPTGRGHGRGRPPAPSSPALPSYSSFISSVKATGAGRGQSVSESDHPTQPTESTQSSKPNLPSSINRPVSHGAGRGKPGDKRESPPAASTPIKEENRHMRPRTRPVTETGSVRPKMSKEEAVKHAMRVLSQGGEGEDITDGGPERGRGRGRGRGRVKDRGRGRDRGGDFRRREMKEEDDDDDNEGFASGLDLEDNGEGEKLAEKLGVENMNMLVEGFEEMSTYVLPSPMDDAYIDALHTNYMV